MRGSIRYVLPLIGLLLLVGCDGKDWRRLNKYVIVADHGDRHAVLFESSTYGRTSIVGPRITHWNTYKDYMLVYKEAYRKGDMGGSVATDGKVVMTWEPPWIDQAGYAIIDTSSGYTTFSATRANFEKVAVSRFSIPKPETVLHSIYPSIETTR